MENVQEPSESKFKLAAFEITFVIAIALICVFAYYFEDVMKLLK